MKNKTMLVYIKDFLQNENKEDCLSFVIFKI